MDGFITADIIREREWAGREREKRGRKEEEQKNRRNVKGGENDK